MIGFLHPWVLAGLAAAGIPILLHLVQRRQPPVVVFPAVRYLVDTTREHQQRLRLRNWLLLLVRTLLIVLVVLAAAGPTAPVRGGAAHSPAALVLVLDNSLSSGAIRNGAPSLTMFRDAAREILDRATPDDRLWLILADGVPRRGTASELARLVDSIGPEPLRLDLGQAMTRAQEVTAGQDLPGEVVMVSDLQRTAVSESEVRVPLLVIRPPGDEPRNLGIGAIEVGPQPWPIDGGRVTVRVTGDSGLSVPLSFRLGNRPPRQALAAPGAAASATLSGVPAGWWPVQAELDPDELLADNLRVGAVRVAPVAQVTWDSANRFLAAAATVLLRNGRISRGTEVHLGRLSSTFTVLEPPRDPALLGALNRSLAARGVGWTFGPLLVETASTDSNALVARTQVLQRHRLVSTGSGRTGVMATVGGEPWIVRSGNVVLLGSRLEPEWTTLPLSATFVPFVDALLNRVARGELVVTGGTPGDPVQLPDRVSEVRLGERSWSVEGGGRFRPVEPGIHYLLAGPDTVGAVAVNFDSRESRLERAGDGLVGDLWEGATFADTREGPGRAFAQGGQGDLRGPLLWMALALGLTEVFLASAWRKAA